MNTAVTKTLSFASLAFGAILYLVSVTGVAYEAATPPGDIGLVSTVLVFLLFGVFGLLLVRAQTADA